MKDKFLAEGNTRGLARNPFVHAVFMHLYQTTKGLRVKADAARVVAMLDELFDQIGEHSRRPGRQAGERAHTDLFGCLGVLTSDHAPLWRHGAPFLFLVEMSQVFGRSVRITPCTVAKAE